MPTVVTPDTNAHGVPLNVSIKNKASTKSYDATTSSQSFAISSNAQSIELVNIASNSGIIYIAFGEGSAYTVSATDFDAVINPGERVQLGYFPKTTHVSYITDVASTLKVIER